MGANLPYEKRVLLDKARMHWCVDDLGFVRGRLGFIGSQLGMAGGLFGLSWS